MKPSEILKRALEALDGGVMWCKHEYFDGDKCCSIGALRKTLPDYRTDWKYLRARSFLAEGVGLEDPSDVADWNDAAPDFSVIEQGFNKAIELALAEGQ